LDELPRPALRRLLAARVLLVSGEAAALALVAVLTPIRLPLTAMLALLALHALLLLLQARALAAGEASRLGAFLHLVGDAVLIAALVYFSGGYTNPFVSLLLLPLVLTAALLPAGLAWVMTGLVALLYTLLMTWHHPLRLDMTDREAGDLHLTGMWLSFLFTAVLVAAFVARLQADLRARDRALAEAKEAALRDEQLFALGMQAAAAAHDLATPLSTLELELEALRSEYANDDELAPTLTAMTAQTARMRAVLDRLRAFAARTRDTPLRPVDAWVAEQVEHWQLMRPQARVSLAVSGPPPAPAIADDPLLASCLITLLNNAADGSPQAVALELSWSSAGIEFRVLDRGPGLETPAPKAEGWGVGLQLAQAVMDRLGGQLLLSSRPGGGTLARLLMPLHETAAVQGEPPNPARAGA
jgi:two-component system sensor histidine kinase RegB